MAAVDVAAAADATVEVLARPDGPLLRHVLARVDAVAALTPVLGVALVQNLDQSVVSGGLDEREVGAMALQPLTRRGGHRLAPAGLVETLAHLLVAYAHALEDGVV